MKAIYINHGRLFFISFFILLLFLNTCTPALSQQNIIADKDNTRPVANKAMMSAAYINSLSVQKWAGYNEIKWAAIKEQDIRKYIIEYSTNGIDFQSAGEMMVSLSSDYTWKHYINFDRPILYRIRMEQMDGRSAYSASILLENSLFSPVNLYPTIISNNNININAEWPVERLVIISSNGTQVYSKELNGQMHNIALTIPSLGKGVYYMNFYGKDWRSTGRFVVN